MASIVASYSCLCLALTLLTKTKTTHGADPDPVQDLCVADLTATGRQFADGYPCKPLPDVVPDDFFSDRMTNRGDTGNVYGVNVTRDDLSTFPGLNTIGLSIARVDFAPGGVNRPHTHPRGAEMVLVHEGELLVGFVTCSNQLYSKVVKKGEVFVIPRGLMHFQANVGRGRASYYAIINSQSAGLMSAPLSLFGAKPGIPDYVLAKAFLMDETVVRGIKTKIAKS